MRRITFIGNCQINTLRLLYQRFVAPRDRDELTYVRSYKALSSQDRDAIARADVIVEQVFDFTPDAEIAGIATTAERHYVPVVTAAFLWPQIGRAHPQSVDTPSLVGGPFPADMGDMQLNRFIKKGLSADEAYAAWLALDFNEIYRLDRLHELVMDRQRARDALTGYSIADIIERHFRDEMVFLHPYHPNIRVVRAWATQFFRDMGAPSADTLRMEAAIGETPFRSDIVPIHPSVVRHFGLSYMGDDFRYPVLREGVVTLKEYVARYVRFDWNERLQEGLVLAATDKTELAIAKLREGLLQSPASAAGHGILSELLARTSLDGEALAEARRAIELEPDRAPHHARLARMLLRRGELDGAEIAARAALACDLESDPNLSALLGHILRRRERPAEAADAFRHAAALDPYHAIHALELGRTLNGAGDLVGAEAAYREAIAREPSAAAFAALSGLLRRLERIDEAIAAIEHAIALDPKSAEHLRALRDFHAAKGGLPAAIDAARRMIALDPANGRHIGDLGHLLARAGNDDEAEPCFRRAVDALPEMPGFVVALMHLLLRRGRNDEALAVIEAALGRTPTNAALLGHAGHLKSQAGDHAGAAELLARAAAVEPDNPQHHARLSGALVAQGRTAEAVAAARRAVALQPQNLHWHGALAHVLIRADALEEAEAEMRTAVALDPKAAGAFGSLSHVLALQDKVEEAIEAARRAVELDSRNAHLHHNLARLLRRRGDLGPAEEEARAAVSLDPNALPFANHLRETVAERARIAAAATAIRAETPGGPEDLTIVFGAGGNAKPHQRDGWSEAEPHHCWTLGQQSMLVLPRPAVPGDYVLALRLAPLVAKRKRPSQRLAVEVSGTEIGAFRLNALETIECALPWRLIADRPEIVITFRHPDAARPVDLAVGRDTRALAFAFESASVLCLRVHGALGRPLNPSPISAAPEPLRAQMLEFESLGENCEFGLVQRRGGAEPLGLLRFSSTPLKSLLAGLDAKFADLGRPDALNVKPSRDGHEYMATDRIYGFHYHTWTAPDKESPAKVHEREVKRLPFLARRLVEDLTEARKMFVYRGMKPMLLTDVLSLWSAIRRYGPNTLLWVELADAEHPTGTVERLRDGLLKGYIDRFAPPEHAPDFSFDAWLAICRNARRLQSEGGEAHDYAATKSEQLRGRA